MRNFEIGDKVRTETSRTDRVVIDIIDNEFLGTMIVHRAIREDGKPYGAKVSSTIERVHHI